MSDRDEVVRQHDSIRITERDYEVLLSVVSDFHLAGGRIFPTTAPHNYVRNFKRWTSVEVDALCKKITRMAGK